ncbi:ensconsin isoform X2 [Thalassophryne amazonica]|uniref:ensconsin isoform X2 n=1 Tax=Thalassophryne amazonica TaxID=390379 RepID=UPI0014726826|nr:ensconsin isoform X2 [Thalassophryne amazonica]
MPDSKGRGGGGCSQGKWSLRKGSSRSAIPALFTITEEEEGWKRRDACRRRKRVSYFQDGRSSSATRPGSSGSGQTYTPTLTPSMTPTPTCTLTSNSPNNNAATKADSLLFNKTDERQRLARERREERDKQNAAKEAQWQAREERARQHYEKHLEERKRRLEEQRAKEEKRRAAVEEKRRQKMEEDRVRHEAVMRRTLERSQRARQKPNRWSWGGTMHTDAPSTAADADRRSVSTMNLSKHADPVITKRLSSSSATLLHSPDRGRVHAHLSLTGFQTRTASSPVINKAQSKPRLLQGKTTHNTNTGFRRLPLTPWESTMVNRLQQPTHSYLARSRSAASLSGELTVSCHPMGSMSFKALQAQQPPHCRSQERTFSREMASSTSTTRRRTTGGPEHKDQDFVRKSWSNLSFPLTPVLTLPPKKLSTSSCKLSKVTPPSPGRPPQKNSGRPPTPKMLKSPSAEDPGNLRPLRITPLLTTPTRSKEEGGEQLLSPLQPRPQPVGQNKTSTDPTPPAASESVSTPPSQKPPAGITDPEEASRILSEKRRLAREQREREEEERRLQEEQARIAREEMARRKAEERMKREEEAQRQAEESRRKEEEERKAEEERLEKEREEAERAQKQKEEEESRQREEAERVRQEREKHFQKEEAERLERKKRLEEIMRRTRRSDTPEKKVMPSRNGDTAVTPASPGLSAASVAVTHHSNSNSRQVSPGITALSPRENGDFKEVTAPSSHSRLTPPEGEEQRHQQERVPVLAFREIGLLKPLSGMEDFSAQQGPDVA